MAVTAASMVSAPASPCGGTMKWVIGSAAP